MTRKVLTDNIDPGIKLRSNFTKSKKLAKQRLCDKEEYLSLYLRTRREPNVSAVNSLRLALTDGDCQVVSVGTLWAQGP